MKKEDVKNSSRRRFLKTLSISVPAIGGALAGTSAWASGNHRGIPKGSDAGSQSGNTSSMNCDLMVYGATSAGVIAAYAARMYGLNVLLVEPGRHLGGLTSGGLGATDIGREDSYLTGLSRDFYQRVGHYYGQPGPAYRFEPHVAELIFENYLDEAGVEVLFSRRVSKGHGAGISN